MQDRPEVLSDLELTQVDKDVVVYDSNSKQVHCLEQKAGLVFSRCDGTQTVEEITEGLKAEAPEMTQDEVEGILNRFLDLGLLKAKSWTRRELLAKAAAVALISTIVAPTPAAAQSGPTTPPPTTLPTTPPPTTLPTTPP